MPDYRPVPTDDEVNSYFQTCSNWGRWGPDDSAGTINLITTEKRVEAASMVKSGRAVSLSRPWDTIGKPGNWNPAQHFVQSGVDFSADYIGIRFHGYATTHVDSLCHIFWESKMWNGKPAEDVTSFGARSGDVAAWSNGITTRGVLVDIPRHRGVDYVAVDEPVRGYEIEEAAAHQGVELRPGDALCVYSGREKFFAAHPEYTPGVRPQAGLQVDCVPVLKERDVSILVWDQMDHRPTPYAMFEEPPRAGGPVHVFAIVYLGLPLLDNSLLEPLADACAEEGRYEFMLTVNPLHIPGGTGSPVNPIAVL
jgi:hypothetical protein